MIPKIFHFIWLGSPLPDFACANIEAWGRMHPGWKVMVWDFDAAEKLPADCATGNFHEVSSLASKSDILRLQVLHRFGGVYLDCDMEPLSNIEPALADCHTGAFCGWEKDGKSLNNAVIGAAPGHRCIYSALANLNGRMLRAVALASNNAASVTGPGFLNEIWMNDAGMFKFPSRFFYPYGGDEPWRAGENFPQSFAVHRWMNSWVKADGVIPKSAVAENITVFKYATALDFGARSGRLDNLHERAMNEQSMIAATRVYASDVLRSCAARLGINRVLFIPNTHIADRRMVECHAALPRDCIGIGLHRLFSAAKIFNPDGMSHFPFRIFELHGLRASGDDNFTGNPRKDFRAVVSLPFIPENLARLPMVDDIRAILPDNHPCVPVWGAMSNEICNHPVNEKVS